MNISSGYGYGSLMWIPIETAFVNPDNVPAIPASVCLQNASFNDGCKNDTITYFSDENVLNRWQVKWNWEIRM